MLLLLFDGIRIYLTESMGGVLGANVMRDHNVVFDHENHKIGFADGVCEYKAEALDKEVVLSKDQVFLSSRRVQSLEM